MKFVSSIQFSCQDWPQYATTKNLPRYQAIAQLFFRRVFSQMANYLRTVNDCDGQLSSIITHRKKYNTPYYLKTCTTSTDSCCELWRWEIFSVGTFDKNQPCNSYELVTFIPKLLVGKAPEQCLPPLQKN